MIGYLCTGSVIQQARMVAETRKYIVGRPWLRPKTIKCETGPFHLNTLDFWIQFAKRTD